MRPDTNPRNATLDLLSQHPNGLALLPLLERLFAYHETETICRQVEDLVQAGQVCMRLTEAETERDQLLFSLALDSAQLPAADITAIDILIKRLASNQDGRGDFDRMMGIVDLLQQVMKYAPRFKQEDWMAAMRVLFEEKLLELQARPRNGYVTVSLNNVTHYTVIAVDMESAEPYHFIVRAGTPAVALAKVDKEMRHRVPRLQCVCTLKHTREADSVPGAPPLEHIHL